MSAPWAAVNPVLISVFTDLAVRPGRPRGKFTAVWQERAQTQMSEDQRLALTLKVTSCVRVPGSGRDRVEYREGVIEMPNGETFPGLVPVVEGVRRIVLNCQARTLGNTDEHWGLAVLDRVDSGLRHPVVSERLRAAGVAVVDTSAIQDVTVTFDNRRVPAAVLDVTMNVASCYRRDEPEFAVSFISTVYLTGRFLDQASPYPAPPSWVQQRFEL